MLKKIAPVAVLSIAAALTFAAPAGASVAELDVEMGLSNGFGSGCQYTVTAMVTGGGPVRFADNAAAVFTPGQVIAQTGGSATVNWIPQVPGTHTISAEQDGNVQRTTVTVGTGISTGSTTCHVF